MIKGLDIDINGKEYGKDWWQGKITYETEVDLWILYYDKVQEWEANINRRWYIGDKDRYYSAHNFFWFQVCIR